MAIVGFNFTRMHAERRAAIRGRLNINNNITIKDVQEADLAFGKSNESALRFMFEFTSTYEPKAGEIVMQGELIDMVESKDVKEVMDSWKKKKQVPQQTMTRILTTILNRCNIQALVLSRDINLPPPIPMPRVNVQEATNSVASQVVGDAPAKGKKKK